LIKKSGFNILNVANNHVLEHGKSKFINMLESLKERGISVIGSCKNPFIIIRVGGIKLGFIGISQVQDPNYVKNTYINDINTAYRLIKTNKEKVDHIIVSVHWGQEYTLKPTQEQRELGHRLIDAGARILIGHHPHTVHKVEEYNNGLIIYSLGNFISDMSFPITRYGKVVKIKLNKFKISDFETFYTYQDQKYRVILLDNKPKPLETEVNPKDLSQEYRLYLKKEFAQKFLSRPLGVNLYLIKNYIIKR